MRRGVRDVRGTALRVTPAQVRQDLAEQIQLLQHGLQGQAGVVDQEELALVVAHLPGEGQRAFEHLLRRTDGERRLGHEVLQARPVAVHRCYIEVRTELVHGVLGVPPHEELPTEADDRGVRRAVAVVLEALPVEVHHPFGVGHRPEDVVVEEPVAVVRGLLGDLRAADRTVPHERRHPVQRTRGEREALQRRAEPALPVHDLLAPQPAQQRVVLDRQRDALADVLAEPGVDGTGIAASQHQVDPAVRQVLQHRVVLGDLHRVVGGDQGGRGGEDDPLGPGGDEAEQRGGRGRVDRRGVVLAGREHVQADLLGLLRDRDRGPDPLVLGRGASGRRVGGDVPDAEDTQLHTVSNDCRFNYLS